MSKLIQLLSRIIYKHGLANKLDEDTASKIVKGVITELIESFGGQMFYLPSRSASKTAQMHYSILTEFNGSNERELCQKYGISLVWLKKLLKRATDMGYE
jgi:Mor family transcriptional regulator